MDSYTFIATSGARDLNKIYFVIIFLKDQVLFYWQQYKQKIGAKILVPIYWDNFKTFLRHNLGKLQVFVDHIW